MKISTDYAQGMSLHTWQGEAKYLDAAERERFYNALDCLSCPADRTFCELIYWTGCRPSEALALTPHSIDMESGFVAIRSLKKRRRGQSPVYRYVPLPRSFLEQLDEVHFIRRAQGLQGNSARLWDFGRTTGWKRIKDVMMAAGISGIRACARGLRHTFGVHAALSGVPETRIKTWLGHARLSTTEIYLDLAAPEDRAMMARMWAGKQRSPDTTAPPTAEPYDCMVVQSATTHEVVRIVNAFSAVQDPGKRQELLGNVEACVQDQPPSPKDFDRAA